MANPRSPEEAKHEYYLAQSEIVHQLRYPPQYADIRLNDRTDAIMAAYCLSERGVDYAVCDREGKIIRE